MLGKLIKGVQVAAIAPVAAQVAGAGAALIGLWMLTGTAVTLVVGGLAAVSVGALKEAKLI